MTDNIPALIKAGYLARREGRSADALREFSEAVALCRQGGTPRDLIEALKGLGQIERDMGRGDAALPLYVAAVKLCRKESDALLLAHTVRHLGDIHQDAGRFDDAEPCYREALAIYRSETATGKLDLANALRPFAILQEQRANKDEAIRLWSEARDLYDAVGVREGVEEATRRLAYLSARSAPSLKPANS